MSEPIYRIKPLKWEPEYSDWYTAKTLFGSLHVYLTNDGWCFEQDEPEEVINRRTAVNSLEAGKARADEWYRSRLMNALEPVCQE